jgi:hypothetical protein
VSTDSDNTVENVAHDVSKAADSAHDLAQQLAAQSEAMSGSAGAFVQAAGTGFQVTPEAAAILIKACQDSIDELDGLHRELDTLTQAPKLGTLPGALEASRFTQRVATDEQGIIVAVANLKATLIQMAEAYRRASTNYEQTEQLLFGMLNRQKAGLPEPNDGGRMVT